MLSADRTLPAAGNWQTEIPLRFAGRAALLRQQLFTHRDPLKRVDDPFQRAGRWSVSVRAPKFLPRDLSNWKISGRTSHCKPHRRAHDVRDNRQQGAYPYPDVALAGT